MNDARFLRQLRRAAIARGLLRLAYVAIPGLSIGGFVAVLIAVLTRSPT